MRRAVIFAMLLATTGCYNYGYRDQWGQFVWGMAPWNDVILVRKGKDARERREAMVRLARHAATLKGEQWDRYSGRVQIAYSTSAAHEPDPLVRATAAALLRQVGCGEDVPALRRSLLGDAKLALEPEASPLVRREVVKTLGLLGADKDVALLGDILRGAREDAETRIEAAYSLGEIGSRSVVPVLIDGLKDLDEGVVFACWDGLHRTTGEDLSPSEAAWSEWWGRRKGRPLRAREVPVGNGEDR